MEGVPRPRPSEDETVAHLAEDVGLPRERFEEEAGIDEDAPPSVGPVPPPD